MAIKIDLEASALSDITFLTQRSVEAHKADTETQSRILRRPILGLYRKFARVDIENFKLLAS